MVFSGSRRYTVCSCAQSHHPYVIANRLKVLAYNGANMWLCTQRPQDGSFAWPRRDVGSINLRREQIDWIVARVAVAASERTDAAGHYAILKALRCDAMDRTPAAP